MRSGIYEKAGELYQHCYQNKEAMEAYRQGGAFRKAVELARSTFPEDVVRLEQQWADHLVAMKQYDTAIIHYVEAGLVHYPTLITTECAILS